MYMLKLSKFIFQTDSDMRTRVQIQFLRLTSILGAVPCDRIDGQPGSDVARTDHGHLDPVALDLGPQAVEEGLGGVL